jgi:hypothetical protein
MTATITLGSITRHGVVKSAQNYGTDQAPNWYVELDDNRHGPVYWKQASDGGTIRFEGEQ